MTKFISTALIASLVLIAAEAPAFAKTNHGKQKITVGNVTQSANGGNAGSCQALACRTGRGGDAGSNTINIGNRS